MRADLIQATVARCLVDPDYFDALSRSASGDGGILPSNLPIEKIERFRGFITRIKHTQIRKVAPCTLKLLNVLRLDLDFFAGVAPDYQRRRAAGPLPLADLFLHFVEKLSERLEAVPPETAQLVSDVLGHEVRLWQTSRVVVDPAGAAHPKLREDVSVAQYDFHVASMCHALATYTFDAKQDVADGGCFILYERRHDGTRFCEIDALSACVLSRLDGATPIAVIEGELGQVLGRGAGDIVRFVIADAEGRGLSLPGEGQAAVVPCASCS